MKTINNKWWPKSRIDPVRIYNVEWVTGEGTKTRKFLDFKKSEKFARKKANEWDVVYFEIFNIEKEDRVRVDFLAGVSL